MRFVVVLLAALYVAVPAVAQQPAQDQPPPADTQQSAPPPPADAQPAPPSQQAPPPAAAPSPSGGAPMAQPGTRPAPGPKRTACRNEVRQKGLRGPSAKDAMQLCLMQARESCLKEAVAKKVGGMARRDFIKNCMS